MLAQARAPLPPPVNATYPSHACPYTHFGLFEAGVLAVDAAATPEALLTVLEGAAAAAAAAVEEDGASAAAPAAPALPAGFPVAVAPSPASSSPSLRVRFLVVVAPPSPAQSAQLDRGMVCLWSALNEAWLNETHSIPQSGVLDTRKCMHAHVCMCFMEPRSCKIGHRPIATTGDIAQVQLT